MTTHNEIVTPDVEALARVIIEAYGEANDECPCKQDYEVAAHIIAAGYKREGGAA